MKALLAAAAAVAALAQGPAAAQPAGAAGPSAEPKVNQLYIYGNDPCPPSTEDQINVCFRLPDGDRYRIPTNLRSDPNDPNNQAWGARARELEYVGRSGIGSCSPVGPGGSIGCFNDIVRAARAERNSTDAMKWNLLVEQSRKERLSKIDAEARAIEGEPPAAAPPK
jgi:hypothetical protein